MCDDFFFVRSFGKLNFIIIHEVILITKNNNKNGFYVQIICNVLHVNRVNNQNNETRLIDRQCSVVLSPGSKLQRMSHTILVYYDMNFILFFFHPEHRSV